MFEFQGKISIFLNFTNTGDQKSFFSFVFLPILFAPPPFKKKKKKKENIGFMASNQ